MNANNVALIKSLTAKRMYSEALDECEKLLISSRESSSEILRLRAFVYSKSGQFDRAVEDYSVLLRDSEVQLRDVYLAADNALEAGCFNQAREWFSDVLRIGEDQNETWFRSASLFYLVYCEWKTGRGDIASEWLSILVSEAPDTELFLPELGVCNVTKLRTVIARPSVR